MKLRAFLVGVALVWMGAVLNLGLAMKIQIFGVHPDFLLLFLAGLTLFVRRAGGALMGFACGLIYGSLNGANLAAYGISRTVTGFLAGWFNDVGFQPSVPVSAVATACVTVLAQLLLMFVAPPPQLLPFLRDTIGTAFYNGVLAMPLYLLLRKLLDPPNR